MATDRRPLVLYAEDDPDLATLVAEVLEQEGFATAVARSGKQALALLDRGIVPALVITDMMMPELDGFGFLEGYRARPGPLVPVLAVSAFEPYLAAARRAGAAACLAKPFSIDALLAAVRALLARAPVAAAPAVAPRDETARLAEILALRLEEPPPTDALRSFAERVARIFDVAACLVSIVNAERQYWHAACGLPDELAAAGGTPRADSFCTHAVVARAALVVQDAAENPFFRDNTLVRERGLRFYAGVPLFSRRDEALGTLCLLDDAPKDFGYFDLELLGLLARRVVAELEWRERRERPAAPLSAFRYLEYLDEELDVLGRVAFGEALLVESLRSAERRQALAVGVAAVAPEQVRAAAAAVKAAFPRAHVGRLGQARLGVAAIAVDGEVTHAALARACGPGAKVLAESVTGPGSGRVLLARLERALGDAGLARG